MKILFLLFFLGYSLFSHSQRAKEFMFAVHINFVQTANDGVFKKFQDTELNYFWNERFSIGIGHEYVFVRNRPGVGPLVGGRIIGGRFYPISNFFVRLRAIAIPISFDFSTGIGWSTPFRRRWRAELVTDYYHYTNDLALRGGVAYAINSHE